MAIKVFACAEMASENVQSYCVSAKFYANEAYAKIHDGALVVLGDLDTNDAYGTPDYNVYKATQPTAVTDDVVIVDPPRCGMQNKALKYLLSKVLSNIYAYLKHHHSKAKYHYIKTYLKFS